MSEVIELKQWAGKTVTPKDDACMYDSMLGDSGYITGCELTNLGSGQIRIGTGRGVIKGRQFVILEHTITVPLSQSGTLPGRLYIHMDLAAADPISIISETAANMAPLIQDEDCNINNGVYEIELGTYNASALTISDLVKTINLVNGYKELKEEMETSLGGCVFYPDSDGVYVTYTPPGGADPVTKKLGSGLIKTGIVTNIPISTYNYNVECGFKPVFVNVMVKLNGTFRSINTYDERVDTTVHKLGNDTENTVGLPIYNVAIYNTGFKLNQGYGYSGWTFHYVALGEFPD